MRAILVHKLRIADFQHAAHLSLDGGQILPSVLWYVIGRRPQSDGGGDHRPCWRGRLHRSGAMDAICLVWSPLCIHADELLEGAETSASLIAFGKAAAPQWFACPRCNAAPPMGEFWKCGKCRHPIDTFQTQAACPHCAARHTVTSCLDCGGPSPMCAWIVGVPGAIKV